MEIDKLVLHQTDGHDPTWIETTVEISEIKRSLGNYKVLEDPKPLKLDDYLKRLADNKFMESVMEMDDQLKHISDRAALQTMAWCSENNIPIKYTTDVDHLNLSMDDTQTLQSELDHLLQQYGDDRIKELAELSKFIQDSYRDEQPVLIVTLNPTGTHIEHLKLVQIKDFEEGGSQ